jgi:hypothetical protein
MCKASLPTADIAPLERWLLAESTFGGCGETDPRNGSMAAKKEATIERTSLLLSVGGLCKESRFRVL